jgi:hypothetical protein
MDDKGISMTPQYAVRLNIAILAAIPPKGEPLTELQVDELIAWLRDNPAEAACTPVDDAL